MGRHRCVQELCVCAGWEVGVGGCGGKGGGMGVGVGTRAWVRIGGGPGCGWMGGWGDEGVGGDGGCACVCRCMFASAGMYRDAGVGFPPHFFDTSFDTSPATHDPSHPLIAPHPPSASLQSSLSLRTPPSFPLALTPQSSFSPSPPPRPRGPPTRSPTVLQACT